MSQLLIPFTIKKFLGSQIKSDLQIKAQFVIVTKLSNSQHFSGSFNRLVSMSQLTL